MKLEIERLSMMLLVHFVTHLSALFRFVTNATKLTSTHSQHERGKNWLNDIKANRMISNLLENIYSFKHAVELNAQLLGEYSRNLKNQEGVNDGQFPIQEEFINSVLIGQW